MSLDFFNNLKENLEKSGSLSKITDGIATFIGELSEALQNINNKNDMDIVTQIVSNNKLSIESENEINKVRSEVVSEYANNTKDEGALYFIFNKVKGEENYRVWKINEGKKTQTEIAKSDLPQDAKVNSVLRIKDGKLITDEEASRAVTNEIKNRADKIIKQQNKRIEDYKKEGHAYVVTEDINGRVFLWDSTEKPKNEIEDVYFPEELKDKAKEGNTFLYQNGTYTHIS